MRLLTRSDFDGLACGALLEYLGLIDEWKFVHPKDIQDGLVQVTDQDILANIPYVRGCKLWFDHHSSENERLGNKVYFEGVSRKAPSCARVIYEFYGGDEELGRFSRMVRYVDKVDSGNLTKDEIMDPKGWILLGFVMDPRTGLGRFRNFSISNYELMQTLAKACANKDINEIIDMPDVKERIDLYMEHSTLYKEMLLQYARIEKNAVVIDLRSIEPIYAGNRFIIYTLFPEQNVSLWIIDGKKNVNCVITVGYSIVNKTCTVDIGSLLLKYGGGGHQQVGTCQVAYEDADRIIQEIIDKLTEQPAV
ncbi:MAG: exopolyphosphatase [Spirochaetaceae bacterium]|jgi:nanoRNase/pAp phosphatase (c-di-AMP/oligoRNAs hydrolase)|nr:exopolyphosphatase [Spirochaetaceae bacterium]